MKLIIDCEAANIPRALALLREQAAEFERYAKVGWGWTFQLGDARCFVRRIKEGLSLKQIAANAQPELARLNEGE